MQNGQILIVAVILMAIWAMYYSFHGTHGFPVTVVDHHEVLQKSNAPVLLLNGLIISNEGDIPASQKKPKSHEAESKKDSSDSGTSSSSNNLDLQQFVEDPSFSARCQATVPPLENCPSRPLPTTNVAELTLYGPVSKGATTQGMQVKPMSKIVGKEVRHHPIFYFFAKRAYHPFWIPGRIVEFSGVHTRYDYDCEGEVDFRMYHQVRAAMCEEYEERKVKYLALQQTAENGEPLIEVTEQNTIPVGGGESVDEDEPAQVDDAIMKLEAKKKAGSKKNLEKQIGMFPLVDEEYFEYMMTLTAAFNAARRGEDFTYIELGSRYGTWIVRAGAAYRMMSPSSGKLNLLAVEGNCGWFQKMVEHVRCNGFEKDSKLILAYAAPRSYNKVDVKKKSTYKEPRAVSLLEMLAPYDHVNLIDFDIQGFEYFTVSEPNVMPLLLDKVAFLHFGTHSSDIEANLLKLFQSSPEEGGDSQWCVVYFFAGAHTKKLNKGHRCNTPFGPSVYNDGVMGIANLKFYPKLKHDCSMAGPVKTNSMKAVAKTCHYLPIVTEILSTSPA